MTATLSEHISAAEPTSSILPEKEAPLGSSAFNSVRAALIEIAAGRPVIVVDTFADKHAGHLLLATAHATPERIAFLVRHTSGVLCVPLEAAQCDRLGLPPMVRHNESPTDAAFTVSVDAADGVTTGISATDRAVTIRRLGDPTSTADAFSRPGHVLPIRARPGGVLERARYTEAAIDLTRLAGAGSAGVIAAIVNDDSSEVTDEDLAAFTAAHGLRSVTITDLISFRLQEGHGNMPTNDDRRLLFEDFIDLMYRQKNVRTAFDRYVTPGYAQHNPGLCDGRDAARGALATMFDDPAFSPQVTQILVDGDRCAVHLKIVRDGTPVAAVVDIYRAEGNRIVEHWDVIQPWPATSANEHPMF